MAPPRLVAFDLDGTLLPGTSVTLFLAGRLGLRATVGWRFAARVVAARFGFLDASGAELAEQDGRLTGMVTRHCTAADKAAFVAAAAAARGIALSHCAAVGDSRSDLLIFAMVGRAIALNATPDAVAAAAASLRAGDLRDVLPHLLAADA